MVGERFEDSGDASGWAIDEAVMLVVVLYKHMIDLGLFYYCKY